LSITLKGVKLIMGTFRKIPKGYEVSAKNVKLWIPPSDERARRDKETGLWIKHRKRVYLHWYKFLQICLVLDLKVNKKKYVGWDIDTILETPFDIWWKTHKKDLFQTKEKGQEPKCKTSTDKIKYESIRYTYFVCCLCEGFKPYKNGKFTPLKTNYNNYRIAYHIYKYELMHRYPTRENGYYLYPTETNRKPSHYNKLDALQKVEVGQHVSRHKGYYKKILEHVCNGQFP